MVTASRMVFGKLLASKHFPRARRFSEAVSPKLSARNPKIMKERSSSESFHGYEQVVFRESWAHPIHLHTKAVARVFHICHQFSWGLVLDGASPVPISTPTADRGSQG